MEIRRAKLSDAPAILDCMRVAFEPYRTRYTAAAFQDTVPRSLEKRLQSMTLFVAVDRGVIVGTIGCAAHGPEGHLRGMAVRPESQGSGAARLLIEAAEEELRRSGCERVTLDTTEPLERAMRFYEKCGYRRTGRVIDFFGMPLTEFAKSLSTT